ASHISPRNLSQRKEMTLPQQNIALARPTNFYYLKCKFDRAQYLHGSNKLLITINDLFELWKVNAVLNVS
ncbi:hypothetical protein, partial [Lentilactobacillus hilgardii]|uniref:hypothetical protein n=1 Tax=Lentilactobacillus hilgardii TaxID=1588 RepID=UPI0021C3D996